MIVGLSKLYWIYHKLFWVFFNSLVVLLDGAKIINDFTLEYTKWIFIVKKMCSIFLGVHTQMMINWINEENLARTENLFW